MLSGEPTLALWWHACLTRNSMSSANGKPAGFWHARRLQRPPALVWTGRHHVEESSTRKQTEWRSGAEPVTADRGAWSVVSCELTWNILGSSLLSTCISLVESESWTHHPAMPIADLLIVTCFRLLCVTMIIRHLDYSIMWQAVISCGD